MSLGREQRRALELLADAGPGGCTDDLLFAHGFTTDLLGDLLRGALATVTSETVRSGGRTIEVVRLKITDTARKALLPNL